MYIDNGSTTPLSQEVKHYLISILDIYGNPSSIHSVGFQSKQIINTARNNVAKFINANPENIIFTSSGSASNNLAIKGYMDKYDGVILYCPLCHKSIIECAKLYTHSHSLKVNSDGLIDIGDLKDWLRTIVMGRAFVVIPYADSEIGTIQEIRKIIDLVHFYHGKILLDCTGSISTIPVDVKRLQSDLLTFSGHKLGALKGVGVLYKNPNIELKPLIYGSQEQGLFAGTENLLGIASLGKAVELYKYSNICMKNRDYVLQYIKENIPNSYLVGNKIYRLANNLYVCFQGVSGEALMTLLDQRDIQVSTGLACSSGDLTPSSTLLAIGIDEDDIHSCIRITFSGNETKKELDFVCNTLKKCVNILRKF